MIASGTREISQSAEKPALPTPLWDSLDEISARIDGRQMAVFLDYDGTLAPIAPRPELAAISPEMRAAVADLAERCPVAVLSGRARHDVEALVGVPSIIYAGSHGFDIAGPGEQETRNEIGASYVPALQEAERLLHNRLGAVAGALIEGKTYSIAVHYRQVAESDLPAVEAAIDEAVARFPELRKAFGKKVFELRPDIDWDKGRALLWLLDALDLDRPDVIPLCIGDDVTDEDAFRVLRSRGIGILVAEQPRPSFAPWYVRDAEEVRTFLDWLRKKIG